MKMMHFLLGGVLSILLVGPASAAQFTQKVPTFQGQQVDSTGRLTRLAAYIRPFECTSNQQENRRVFWLYEYVDAQGRPRPDIPNRFRVIIPGNFSRAVGGTDWADWNAAVSYACHMGMPGGPAIGDGWGVGVSGRAGTGQAPPPNTGGTTGGTSDNITGTWQLKSICNWVQGGWNQTVILNQAANGALTGSSPTTTPLNLEIPPPTVRDMWGSTMVSRFVNPTMTLVIHPVGWLSVIELTGTLSNVRAISGKAHHYDTDDCTFSMTR